MRYIFLVFRNVCEIYNSKDFYTNRENSFLGKIIVDETGAWTPHYSKGVKYLPINEALEKLNYKTN